MHETLKPIVGNKKINKNRKDKYITTYTCPMCGEYLRKPAQGFLLYENEVVKNCPYCETQINWEEQKDELIAYKKKKEEKYQKEKENQDEE